eukprot:CAMPEP_0178981962 /NCGR_PEP_ID=MMETSP0795-20121207/235_1 /TAXON_ID=88552 /ORGANISM="Amoebophrya sp., Strain Ameob2" /LENGTH=113 /DNA_ID=CAMNT_0020672561 /DNA_START=88 /DNA_END=429 /DNA_ORIENTATION=+
MPERPLARRAGVPRSIYAAGAGMCLLALVPSLNHPGVSAVSLSVGGHQAGSSTDRSGNLEARRSSESEKPKAKGKANPTAVDGYIKFVAKEYLAHFGITGTHPYWAKPDPTAT